MWFQNTNFYVLFLLVTTNLTIQPGFTKPPPQKMLHNNTCILQGNILTRDPFSCAHFLSCSNSQTIRRKCPDGLLFDAILLRCDHPKNVNCSNSIATQPPHNTTTSTTATTATNATIPMNICRILRNGLTKDPSSCAYFLSCSNGRTLRLKCPYGKLFNSHLGVCDHQENVRCWCSTKSYQHCSYIFIPKKKCQNPHYLPKRINHPEKRLHHEQQKRCNTYSGNV